VSKLSKELDQQVREASKNRCGYCLTPQSLTSHKLEIEHIFPISKGGTSTKENLCLACRHCNLHKSSKIYGFDAVSAKRARLFNPNLQTWSEHFVWNKEKTSIIGKSPCGRATIYALKMNDDLQTNARKVWKLTGLFPPKD
jgi:HNH endonuclease